MFQKSVQELSVPFFSWYFSLFAMTPLVSVGPLACYHKEGPPLAFSHWYSCSSEQERNIAECMLQRCIREACKASRNSKAKESRALPWLTVRASMRALHNASFFFRRC